MKKLILPTLVTLGIPALLNAATVSLTDSDTLGTTSFNTGLHWSDATAPSAANDYVTGDFILRTPPDGASYTFAGNSLTVNNANGYPNGLLYKGTGAAGTITINNLILNGGFVSHANGAGDIFNLAGAINVMAPSTIYSKQGDINITASISGAGDVTIPQTDASTENNRYVNLLANNSGFTGKLIVAGRIRIVSEESLGGNPGVLAADQLTLDNATANGGWLVVTNTFTINDGNRGITIGANGGTIFVTNPDTNTAAHLTISSPIAGGGALIKRGSGVLTLSGNNSGLFGGVTLRADAAGSQLNVNSANALGSGTFTVLADGNAPILDNTSGSAIAVGNSIAQTWNNSFTFLGSSSLDMGNGSASMAANVSLTVSNNNFRVGGGVFGDGAGRVLTKQGPGTLTIDGGGTYMGDTIVNEGTLTLTTVGTLSSPTILVASNATLDVFGPGLTLQSGQTLAGSGTVVGAVIDGPGSSISPGTSAGTLTINGSLNLAGGAVNMELAPSTTVGGGVNDLIVVTGQLNLSNPTALNVLGIPAVGTYTIIQYGGGLAGSLANLTVPPGFMLNDTGSAIELIVSHVPASLTWAGDGSANLWDLGATDNWIQDSTNQVFFSGDRVTFDNTGMNTPAINLVGDLSPGSVTVNASQDYTFTGGGITSGGLTKSGSGTLILDNTNAYSGATVINGGTLQVGDLSSGTFGEAGTLGTGPITNNGVLQFARGGGTPLTISSNIRGSGSISNIGFAGDVSLNGTVSGGIVSQGGSGGLRLNGSNDYSGLTLVSVGNLYPRNTNALGLTSTGTMVLSGAQLYFELNQPMSVAPEPITLDGGTMRRGGAQALTFTGPVTLTAAGGTLSADGGSTLTFSNVVGGTGQLTKNESGRVVLAAANTYGAGTLTIANAGNLDLANNNALGNSTGINMTSTSGGAGVSGTRVTVSGGASIPPSKTLSMVSSGAGTIRTSLAAEGAGVTNTWAGPITISGDSSGVEANQVNFAAFANTTFVISGPITTDGTFPGGKINIRGSGSGVGIIANTLTLAPNGQIQVDDGSTWVIASTGNTWGTNRVVNGTLRLGAHNALPTTSTIRDNSRFDMAGFNQTIGELIGGSTITNTSTSADSTLTFAGGTSTFTGSIRDGVRKLNLTIASGTLQLTSASTLNISKSTNAIAGAAVLDLAFVGTNTVKALLLAGVSQPPGLYTAGNSGGRITGTGSLLVQPGPSGPATIMSSVSGGNLDLIWPAGEGWRLEGQTNSLSVGLTGTWGNVAGASDGSYSVAIDPNQPTVFYRLAYP